MSIAAGRTLGGFKVERELGRGGMGVALLVRQESLDRPAVLKRILAEHAADPELEARFEREAHTAARLHHPNVVTVYDRFQYRGAHYIATEYVDGADLAVLLERESPLPWRIATGIALEVARGLEAIHAEGMLHRDLKPQNLLIGRRGEVKITDFGLALDTSGPALTQPGVAVGTPPYMAPEQLRGERLDARADLFAFGCVLYEMLTGRPPFELPREGEDDSLLSRVESGRYPRLKKHCRDAPRALIKLVNQCLRPRVRRRITSAGEVQRRLEVILGRPTPSQCRTALAGWLWDRHVLESRAGETVVMIAPVVSPSEPGRARRFAAAAALAIALAMASFSATQPDRIVGWSDQVASRVTASFSMLPNREASLP